MPCYDERDHVEQEPCNHDKILSQRQAKIDFLTDALCLSLMALEEKKEYLDLPPRILTWHEFHKDWDEKRNGIT